MPAVTVSFEQGTYTVAEGSSVTVKVKLDVDPERTVTIPITKADQGGVTAADYSGVPENVTFNSGDTEVMFTFSATQDSDNDDGESVKLGFEALPTGVSAGTTTKPRSPSTTTMLRPCPSPRSRCPLRSTPTPCLKAVPWGSP